MVNTYGKTVLRMFKSHITRFVVIALLVAVSVAVVSGIGSLAPRLRLALDVIRASGYTELDYQTMTANQIEKISYVFPVFFIAVVGLVVFVTVMRLVESERSSIGCYITLGYGKSSVVARYMLFVGLACLTGCVLGVFFGHFVVAKVLYNAINKQFKLPTVKNLFPTFGLISALVILACMLAVTFSVTFRAAKEKPVNLFLPKAPKAGSKIMLERIPFIWKPLKFKYKSTMRNIFRYKARFVMTVFSVLGSTTLVYAGLALYSSTQNEFKDIMDALIAISVMLIICAVTLDAVIIYNITNINIEERKREIATLKVLGYRNTEVYGYVFRELFILAFFGALLGLPAGFLFMKFLFKFMSFGGVDQIDWYVWVFTLLLSMVSVALADALLFPKIKKVDMNGSLKTIE